jgi:hypothetical protein
LREIWLSILIELPESGIYAIRLTLVMHSRRAVEIGERLNVIRRADVIVYSCHGLERQGRKREIDREDGKVEFNAGCLGLVEKVKIDVWR